MNRRHGHLSREIFFLNNQHNMAHALNYAI
uniref:Uncharacterized protein n=1 Tax=Rhizophora mucronata TaxID=61149 RepID=A0A2P2NE45_RHIMU